MKITPQLIRKYLSNTCTPQEREAVEEWYRNFDDDPDPLRFMDEAEQANLQRSMYKRFKQNFAGNNDEGSSNSFRNKIYTLIWAVSGIAAVLLLVFNFGNKTELTADSAEANLNAQVTVRNNGSSIYKKILPDRSVVWLSPQSTLTFPQKFSGNTRQVNLAGEAFFEVTKDKAHPFIINSGELTTRVWGTSFRVKAFKNLPAEVSVVTGKVSVAQAAKKDEVMLLPDQRVTLVNHNQLIKVAGTGIATEMRIWKKASLSFEDARMENVFAALNKKFNIRIYSTDEALNHLTFTADFTDQNLPAILEMVKESLDAEYTIKDDKTFAFTTNTSL
jgi:transmembrane sensor